MSMEYSSIAGIEKPVSRLIQGTVMFSEETEAKGHALLDAVFAQGCNAFDTAHVYMDGECERVFGRWMRARGIREQVVVIAKGAHHNADRKRVTPFDITADLYDSLARMQTDYLDLYLLHRDDPEVPVGPIVEVLNKHQAAGRIHAFGASNWHTNRIAEANRYAAAKGLTPFAAGSPHFSLAEEVAPPWEGCVTITGPENKGQRDWYRLTRTPLLTWSSLSHGWFSGRITRANQHEFVEDLAVQCYASEENWRRLDRARELAVERGVSVARVALAWVLHHDFAVFPLVGPMTGDEFSDCAAALDLPLSSVERDWLDLRRDSR